MGVDCFVEDDEEEEKLKANLLKGEKKKKVGFADVVDAKLTVDRGQKLNADFFDDGTDAIAKNVIKMIHTGGLADSISNLGASMLKNNQSRVAMGAGGNTNRSLVQSLFQPEPVVM